MPDIIECSLSEHRLIRNTFLFLSFTSRKGLKYVPWFVVLAMMHSSLLQPLWLGAAKGNVADDELSVALVSESC